MFSDASVFKLTWAWLIEVLVASASEVAVICRRWLFRGALKAVAKSKGVSALNGRWFICLSAPWFSVC